MLPLLENGVWFLRSYSKALVSLRGTLEETGEAMASESRTFVLE
jgi:hypothetical protein